MKNIIRSFLLFLASKTTKIKVYYEKLIMLKNKLENKYLKSNPNNCLSLLCGMLASLFIVLVFNLIIFNRFFPLTEGWWSLVAKYMQKGLMPYRDFYLVLPPLYPIKMFIFHSLFGYEFILLRILGVFVSLLTTGFLFVLFSRIFSSWIAALAAILSMFTRYSLNPIIMYDFNEFIYLYAILSAYTLLRFIDDMENQDITGRQKIHLIIAGILTAFCFFTKQNAGLFCFIANTFILFFFTYKRTLKYLFMSFLYFMIGFLTPTLIILLWVTYYHALIPFIEQVYLNVESKGDITTIFFLWIKNFIKLHFGLVRNLKYLLRFLVFLIIFYPRKIFNYRLEENTQNSFSTCVRCIFALVVFSMLSICYPLVDVDLSKIILSYNSVNFFIITISVIIVFLFLFISMYKLIFNDRPKENIFYKPLFILSVVSVSFLFASGTSGGINHYSLMVSIGILFGYLLFRTQYLVVRMAIVGLSFLFISSVALGKYRVPYEWWGYSEPHIKESKYKMDGKYFKGFILSENTTEMILFTKYLIEKNSTKEDSIFVFPHMPVLYLIADRYPKTFSFVHWWDMIDRKTCLKDAKILSDNPPKIIVWGERKDMEDFKRHEKYFGGGRPLGQRAIMNVLNEYIQKGHYKKIQTYRVNAYYKIFIYKKIN
ncbi:ArnT family glycosyltransferase [bacterium]